MHSLFYLASILKKRRGDISAFIIPFSQHQPENEGETSEHSLFHLVSISQRRGGDISAFIIPFSQHQPEKEGRHQCIHYFI